MRTRICLWREAALGPSHTEAPSPLLHAKLAHYLAMASGIAPHLTALLAVPLAVWMGPPWPKPILAAWAVSPSG